MPQEPDQRSAWCLQGRKLRLLARGFFLFTIAFLVATFFIQDLHWATRLSAVFNFIAGLSFVLMGLPRSAADSKGIRVTYFKTRLLPWATIAALRPNGPMRWATSVEAVLLDGTAVTLPGVPAADLPRLDELRASWAEQGSPGGG